MLRHLSRRALSAAPTSPVAVPLSSDLSLRALLRNLKLLKGMRADASPEVVVCGLEAPSVGARLSELEPTLRVTLCAHASDVAGRSGVASVVVVQPYHALRARGELAGVKAALCPDEGTVGFLWARARAAEVRFARARGGVSARRRGGRTGRGSRGGARRQRRLCRRRRERRRLGTFRC